MYEATASSFSLEDLAAIERPLDSARNLPPALFVDPVVHAAETEVIFRRHWLCAGREEDIARPGDFFTRRLFGEDILVVRGADGAPRAFYNICRHRGACLVERAEGSGAKAFRCHYHAWTYDTEGKLIAAPLMDELPGFSADQFPLDPVALERWNGFLYVNLGREPQALTDYRSDLPDLSRFRLDEMRRAHRIDYEIGANWKVVCENFSECYHCALVHPQLNRVSDYRSGGKRVEGQSFNGGPMTLNDGMSTMSMSGTSTMPRIAGLESERDVQYFTLYPHVLIGLAPDYAVHYTLWPEGPGRTRIHCDLLFPETTLAMDTFDATDMIEFWDTTNRQDWDLCEKVQRVSASRGARPGPYHPAEACVHAFDQWYVRTMRERLEPLATPSS